MASDLRGIGMLVEKSVAAQGLLDSLQGDRVFQFRKTECGDRKEPSYNPLSKVTFRIASHCHAISFIFSFLTIRTSMLLRLLQQLTT